MVFQPARLFIEEGDSLPVAFTPTSNPAYSNYGMKIAGPYRGTSQILSPGGSRRYDVVSPISTTPASKAETIIWRYSDGISTVRISQKPTNIERLKNQ